MPSYVKRHVRKTRTERREEIIDATLELMSKRGVEGTTISRIASAVGLTPGAIYRHFDSRAALVAEANRVANDRALSWIERSTHQDTLQRLESIGDAHAPWAREHFNTVVRPFFLELASAPVADLTERLTLTSFKSFQALVNIAEEGKRQGTIRADVPSHDVAWALHMFAWAEDIALMAGAEESIEDGTLARNLQRLLDSFRPQRSTESAST
jgi:AcrR family transcriptional regulator